MFVTLQLFLSGVQIVEVCMANQHKTGGLMELGEIRQKLVRARGRSQHHQEISVDDLLRATKKLKILGKYTRFPIKITIFIFSTFRYGLYSYSFKIW